MRLGLERRNSASAHARRGARVIEIEPASFGHGRTRNLLMREAQGERVALLTQDAEPADERWLEQLLLGLDLAGDVAIAYGPYRPRPSASPGVRGELDAWFGSLSPDGRPTVERLGSHERRLPVSELIGRRGFFTDANACVRREAWQSVPFRDVGYAEDRVLALDMLRAGYAKAFVPGAAVLHSHDYSAAQELRRCFDEWRGLLEVYGWREPASPARAAGQLRGRLAGAHRATAGSPAALRARQLLSASKRELARSAGAMLGSRADALSPLLRRVVSYEGRAGFDPLDLDAASDLPPTARGTRP